ncbi:hypothetical protein [Micromonospora sp. WMMD1082]|uniref:hypothetical protein n=1 Tax=Micromonospora sp. WMMD1082 TaxID=3016104 RepID=UPI00241751A9|nr:hypothetical protein [Micromonospora sp. WMMD1082]MDG4798758.1 hypothetical protein [Micromonospora sp. WMMD1082]
MPDVAPARPLWWLARWAARLLTGFAVAAAFTLGAWAAPAPAAPAERLTATVSIPPPVEAVVPPAPAGWDLVTPHELVDPAAPSVRGAAGHADPGGVTGSVPATPAAARPPVPAKVTAPIPPLAAAVVAGAHATRAPPRS